jgi:hypothetical protein
MAGSAVNLSADMLRAPDVTPATPEELNQAKERDDLLDKMLSNEGLAKYKLEIVFSHKRTARGATGGTVSWWESGTHLNGDGDSKMYLCDNADPLSKNAGKGCGGFIPDSANGLVHVVCPRCHILWKPEEMVGEIYYNMSMEKWADVLFSWYRRMDYRADIYLKYGRMSIRDAQRKEAERGLQGELLNKARSAEQRKPAIYPLKNIIKDTNNGADLRGRILAFIKA